MTKPKSVSIQLLTTLAISSLLLSLAPSLHTDLDQGAEATPEILLAQNEALDAFFSSQYDYDDANILADFFQASIQEAKTIMGNKILSGPVGKALLAQRMVDARTKALNTVDELRYYVDSGYSYEDAEVLASFWGEASPYEAKLRIEKNLILDQREEIETALILATN